MEKAYDYLEAELAKTPPENESWYPAYTAWQAFAVKVLVEGGRNQDSHINAALRLPRSDAGVRSHLSRRRDGREGRDRDRAWPSCSVG